MIEGDNSADDEQYLDREELPDNAMILQCGRVITEDGIIGRVEAKTPEINI